MQPAGGVTAAASAEAPLRGCAAPLRAPALAAPGFATSGRMGVPGRWAPAVGERSAVVGLARFAGS
ncbi:MAG TPA: hypothetical protein VH988_00880 [Thermoanaerobaculia bacterium]|nr:hypothetical protein [Thermoanaerobaculia bacterium]